MCTYKRLLLTSLRRYFFSFNAWVSLDTYHVRTGVRVRYVQINIAYRGGLFLSSSRGRECSFTGVKLSKVHGGHQMLRVDQG